MKVKKVKTKTVLITDKHSSGEDEIYTELFTCPKCKGTICYGDFYCSGCGRKIRWKIKNERT